MFEHIFDYPEDREMGWNAEVNGVCHDRYNWFFTQDGNLWKFPISHDLSRSCKSPDTMKGIYKTEVGGHLGDIDHYKGYIFVPYDGDDKRCIKIFKASDLTFIKEIIVMRPVVTSYTNALGQFRSIGWLAINPNNGLLYTSDSTICAEDTDERRSKIHVYKINLKKGITLERYSSACIYDEDKNPLERGCMQGGTFDRDNHLYICNGYYTGYHKKSDVDFGLFKVPIYEYEEPYANSKGGISVFKVSSSPKENECEKLYRITHSNQDEGFKFYFGGNGDEPEGITYWDINNFNIDVKRIGKKPQSSQLHVIKLKNRLDNSDDGLYFCHFERDFKALPENKDEIIDDGYDIFTNFSVDDEDILAYYEEHYKEIGEYGPPVSELRTMYGIKYQNFKKGVIVKYPECETVGCLNCKFTYKKKAKVKILQNDVEIEKKRTLNDDDKDIYKTLTIQGESVIKVSVNDEIFVFDINNGWGSIRKSGNIDIDSKKTSNMTVENVPKKEFEYIVNTNTQKGGYHQLHMANCSYLPKPANRFSIGKYTTAEVALKIAKETFKKVDGCAKCCETIDLKNL